MLTELHIENIAVIEKADIEFGRGLNVLTGETGAGKSIVIDSIGAVLGGRTSRELIRSGAEKGVVSAVFDTHAADSWLEGNDIETEGELILQRKISADGKNSCRICGVPVTVAQLRELGSLLLDIHGQNDGRQLMDEARHREYLDRFGCLENDIDEYRCEYAKYRELIGELKRLDMDEIEKARLSENLKYEIDELERARIKPGEEEEKTARRDLLHNAEKITESIDFAFDELYSAEANAIALASDAGGLVSRAAYMAEELKETADIINGASAALSDAAERLRDFRDSLDFSPEEYDSLEARLSQLRKLQRKYGVDEQGLLMRLENDRKRLSEIEYADDRTEQLKREIKAQEAVCVSQAAKLSDKRKAAAKKLEQRIENELRGLNMPSVRFAVEFVPIAGKPGFEAYGGDEIRFLMSANAGEAPGRISRIASGGELSRIMLAMKNVFAENDAVPTMVFDEIDTGVSGIAAQRVGEKLSDLSEKKQVLCVTHLPQIAAMADSHYVIAKSETAGRTYTCVDRLNETGRKMELARLHGGDNITETTLKSAGEQLALADKYKEGKKI